MVTVTCSSGRAGRGHRGKVGIQTWHAYGKDLECRVLPSLGKTPLYVIGGNPDRDTLDFESMGV